jgi:hypothetical protein
MQLPPADYFRLKSLMLTLLLQEKDIQLQKQQLLGSIGLPGGNYSFDDETCTVMPLQLPTSAPAPTAPDGGAATRPGPAPIPFPADVPPPPPAPADDPSCGPDSIPEIPD